MTLSAIDSDKKAIHPRASWLLFLGAAIGLGLATFGLLEPGNDSRGLAPDAAARVGTRTIRRIDFERVLAGVEGDRRNPVDDAVRRRVLDRMIDEELLVQRALELGLAAIDRRVRGELTSGLIDSIVGEADADEATEEEVRRHFQENLDFFSRPGRLRAQALFFSTRPGNARHDSPAERRVARALERLRSGEEADEVEKRLADPQVSPLPDTLLPAGKVRDYIGPILLRALEGMDVGAWSEPIASGGGLYIVRLIDREPPIVPDFEDVAKSVRQDLKRRRGDEALRRYLDDLRAETDVVIDESLFSAGT